MIAVKYWFILLMVGALGGSAALAQTPKVRSLKIYNEFTDVYCGEAEVVFSYKRRAVQLITPFGELKLKVTKRKIDEFNSIMASDAHGNVYTVVAIKNAAGGFGFQFIPVETYRMTFVVATQDLCD